MQVEHPLARGCLALAGMTRKECQRDVDDLEVMAADKHLQQNLEAQRPEFQGGHRRAARAKEACERITGLARLVEQKFGHHGGRTTDDNATEATKTGAAAARHVA